MKKLITLFFLSCFTLIGQAQVSKTINISTAGTLSTALTPVELNTVTNLTITGTIDARDFTTMRDVMPALANIDLSGVTITAYSGSAGPAGVKASGFVAKNTAIVTDPLRKMSDQLVQPLEKATVTTVYPANEIPQNAFYKYPGINQSLKTITIPSSSTSIGDYAFYACVNLTRITIPSSVTSIGDCAFNACGLTSITFPSSVTSIGSQAFTNCSYLTSVTIPSSVTSIGSLAFGSNGLTSINVETTNPNYSGINGVLFDKKQLTLIQYPMGKTGSYTIPSSITSIGSCAFFSCSGLTSVTIPSSVTSIGDIAFISCSGLTSVILPPSVITIGASAFAACIGLTSVNIPSSVTSIGASPFQQCSSLTSINVETTNTNYSSINGVLFDKNQLSLIQYPGGKTGSYNIPSSVTAIGSNAFIDCSGLTSITIPSSVVWIGGFAFYSCSGLTSVTIPSSVTSIGVVAFADCTGLTSIYAYSTLPVDISASSGVFAAVNKTTSILYVPIGSKSLYQAAAQWQDFTNIVEKNFSVSKTIQLTAVGTLSTALTPVELNTVTDLTITGTIDARDFTTMRDVMPALANIDLSGTTITAYSGSAGPAGVKALGFGAKNTAIVPDSLRKISVQQVQLLEKATATTDYSANEIPQNAFCKYPEKRSLNAVTMPSSVTSIGTNAFSNCNGLTSVTIPSSVTSIGTNAFSNCNGLTSVTIPSTVTSIGTNAFEGSSGLTTIIVETTNPNYSDINGVLFDKNQLTLIEYPGGKTGSYTIPSSATSIVEWAFAACSGLTSVTIPSSVTSIGNYAFQACVGLTSITIPSSVTSIGSNAFVDCSGLTSINVEMTNPNYTGINGVLFDKNQLTLIKYPEGKTGSYTIPSSVTSIGSFAFSNCNGLTSVTIPSSVTSIGDVAFVACYGLTSIYAYSTLPVDLSASSGVFASVNKTTCILYVPIGSKNAYQAAAQWQDFTNILELSVMGTKLIQSDNISLYPNPAITAFSVKGIEGEIQLNLFDLTGKQVLSTKIKGENSISVRSLPIGVYVVKIISEVGVTEKKLVKY